MSSSNPFWFGYYPGSGPVKRPPNVKPSPIFDFSRVAPEQFAEALDAYLDKVAENVGNVAELPKWLHEKVVSDWKKSFVASAIGSTPPGTASFEFEGQEGVDIPGIQTSINLYELVKDPEKTLKESFLSKQVLEELAPWRQGFWTDLDTALTTELYRDVARDKEGFYSTTLGAVMGTTGKAPINFWNQGVYAKSMTTSSDYDLEKPASAQPAGASVQMAEGEIDVYKEVGAAFTEFVANQKSTKDRGGAYAGLQAAFIKAAATELSQKQAKIVLAIRPFSNPEADNAYHYITVFKSEAAIVESFSEFNKTLTASFGVRGKLSKHAFLPIQRLDHLKSMVGDPAVPGSRGTLGKKIDSVRADIEEVRLRLRDAEISMQSVAPNYAQRYNERLKDFDKRIKPIERTLDRAESLRIRIRKEMQSPTTSILGIESLLRELTAITSSISHPRYGGGIFNQYLMEVSREYFDRDRDLRQKYFYRDDPATRNPIMSDGFYSIDPIYRYSKGQYLRQDGADLIEALISGEYLERRYWYGKWRNFIQVFTPGYWTGKILERMGYFGLVYDEKKHLTYFLNKHDDYGEETLQARIGNILLRPLSRRHRFGVKFKVNVGGKTIKAGGRFEGGSYLANLNKAWVRASQKKLVGLVDSNGQWLVQGTERAQKLALISILNGNTSAFESSSGLKYQMGAVGTFSDFAEAKKAAVVFRKKVLKNKKLVKSLGLELDASGNIIENDKNIAILDGFFSKLDAMSKQPGGIISPFVSRVGLFNVLSSKLTRIQYFESLLLKPFVKPLIWAREMIKNLAAKAFRTALYAVLGLFTGGAGAFLMKTVGPFLEKVFNATVGRFMKYFTDGATRAFKALIRADFDAMFEALAEETAKMLAWAMACGCSVPIFFMLLVLLIFMPLFSAIPTTSVSKTSSSTSASHGTPPPTDPNFANYSCFVKSASLTLGSYNPTTNEGHGSLKYWNDIMPRSCPTADYVPGSTVYSIPFITGDGNGFECYATTLSTEGKSCSPTSTGSAKCIGLRKITNYYGYAADYTGTGGAYAPGVICGKKIVGNWRLRGSFLLSSSRTECGLIMEAKDEDGSDIRAALMHLDNCPSVGQKAPGDLIAPLYAGPTPHIHVELIKNGINVKPEDCDCL